MDQTCIHICIVTIGFQNFIIECWLVVQVTTEISPLPRECIITNTLDYLEVLGRDVRVLKERINQINQSVASMVKPSNLSKNLEVFW